MKQAGIIIILMLTGIWSCKHHPVTPAVSCNLPDTVSYSRDIQPLFDANCALSGCHSGPTPTGNLNLDDSVSYVQLMKPGSGYIDTINPRFSVLHAQMNSVSAPMPPTGKLPQCSLDLVLKWIEQKAKNN